MKWGSRFLSKASSINDLLSGYLALIGGIVIVGLMLIISAAAVSRYFFGRAIASVTELSAYGLLFITFLGAPLLAGKNGHVSVDILSNAFGKKGRKVLGIYSSVISFLISLLLAVYGIKSTYKAYVGHEVVVNILRTPKYLLLGFISLGCFLMAISFLLNVFKHPDDSKKHH